MPPQLPPEPAAAERARMRHLSGAQLRAASPLRLPEEPVRHQSDAEGGKKQPWGVLEPAVPASSSLLLLPRHAGHQEKGEAEPGRATATQNL